MKAMHILSFSLIISSGLLYSAGARSSEHSLLSAYSRTFAPQSLAMATGAGAARLLTLAAARNTPSFFSGASSSSNAHTPHSPQTTPRYHLPKPSKSVGHRDVLFKHHHRTRKDLMEEAGSLATDRASSSTFHAETSRHRHEHTRRDTPSSRTAKSTHTERLAPVIGRTPLRLGAPTLPQTIHE